MANGKRMCPNEACEKHRQPTGLLGGCDCGTPLVAYSEEPSDRQLANFIAILIWGAPLIPSQVALIERMLEDPTYREAATLRHQSFQEKLLGLPLITILP